MKLTLRVWRQRNARDAGGFVTYTPANISPDMSFLEMLDVVNEGLIAKGEDPIAFDHDCREGICGTCGVIINGEAHGPWDRSTTCQLHMRAFEDGDEIVIEPFRARAFPVLQDLIVAAVNDGIRRAQAVVAEEMGKLTGGLGLKLPGLG